MSDASTLEPGLTGELSITVTEDRTAAALGSGSVNVYATPAMIVLLEAAAIKALEGHLAEGFTSVGISVDVKHLAATPVGMTVRARALLKAIDGRRLVFEVSAWDPVERIGEGTHERFIVDYQRFMDRIRSKAT